MNKIYTKLPGLLLPWYRENHRELPWRQDTQPYHVWLSEVMLQQTRVEAVKGYYARFLKALPTVESLANAPEELCHKLWEGLGYYTRVRNLQKAAKVIVKEHGGRFPETYEELKALPGVGEYTAGAIGSICFGLPTPAVDGNVLRVIARLTAEERPIQKVKKEVTMALAAVYPKDACGDLTQALMELGATVCLPNGKPRCESCPLSSLCRGRELGPEKYPVREDKKPRRQENRTVLIFTCGEAAALEKRKDTGLLAGLWQFPNVQGFLTVQEALTLAEAWGLQPLSPVKSVEKEHIFTHVHWKLRGIYISCGAMPHRFTWGSPEDLRSVYALPTAFRQFYEKEG